MLIDVSRTWKYERYNDCFIERNLVIPWDVVDWGYFRWPGTRAVPTFYEEAIHNVMCNDMNNIGGNIDHLIFIVQMMNLMFCSINMKFWLMTGIFLESFYIIFAFLYGVHIVVSCGIEEHIAELNLGVDKHSLRLGTRTLGTFKFQHYKISWVIWRKMRYMCQMMLFTI